MAEPPRHKLSTVQPIKHIGLEPVRREQVSQPLFLELIQIREPDGPPKICHRQM